MQPGVYSPRMGPKGPLEEVPTTSKKKKRFDELLREDLEANNLCMSASQRATEFRSMN